MQKIFAADFDIKPGFDVSEKLKESELEKVYSYFKEW